MINILWRRRVVCLLLTVRSVICNKYHSSIHQVKRLHVSLLTELRKRLQYITDFSHEKFNLIPSAGCLLNPVLAGDLLTPEQASLLHAAKQTVISLCGEDAADPSSTNDAASLTDSKCISSSLVKNQFPY
jgi:hypothetical protein